MRSHPIGLNRSAANHQIIKREEDSTAYLCKLEGANLKISDVIRASRVYRIDALINTGSLSEDYQLREILYQPIEPT